MKRRNNELDGVARFEEALRRHAERVTPSGRAIANYVRDNPFSIPFETGASLASKIGVSEMTIIRLVRSLGYANLKELRSSFQSDLASQDHGLDNALDRFKVRASGMANLRESLDLQLRAVVKAYELTTTDRWRQIVHLIAGQPRVHVVGYQAIAGMAMDFASQLKYARKGVTFMSDTEGVHANVLDSTPADSCLVLVDCFSYARKGVLLAKKARELRIPSVIITDHFSHQAYEFTPLVLQGHTQIKTFWDSTASMAIILNLLIDAVASLLGTAAEERYRLLAELGDYFQEFERGPRDSRPHHAL